LKIIKSKAAKTAVKPALARTYTQKGKEAAVSLPLRFFLERFVFVFVLVFVSEGGVAAAE